MCCSFWFILMFRKPCQDLFFVVRAELWLMINLVHIQGLADEMQMMAGMLPSIQNEDYVEK